MTARPPSALERAANSHSARALMIVLLVVLFLIPISLVRGVIQEREQRRNDAIADVRSTWGGSQSIAGPTLVIPYHERVVYTKDDGTRHVRTVTRIAHFLPDDLLIEGDINGEKRHRGIFDVPVYTMTADISGSFAAPDFSDWGVAPDDIQWDRAHVVVNLGDARAVQSQATLRFNDVDIEFEPGAGEAVSSTAGIHAVVGSRVRPPAATDEAAARADAPQALTFSFALELNGSITAQFAPFGKRTRVELRSDWADPSFYGGWLPATHTIDAQGFVAQWDISYLGRNYPQRWSSERDSTPNIQATLSGVELMSPVDRYRMAYRSVKYGALFIFLTFGTLWLFEVIAGARVQVLHYLLVGAAMCVFYLLELSLSEHIGFALAYVLATLAVVSLTVPYSKAVLGGFGRASMIGVVLVALYGYLYLLLRNQDYALLAGSLGLFVALAIVMYLTRRVDWGKRAVSDAA